MMKLVFSIILFLYISACNDLTVKTNLLEYSNNIEKSKENKVFIESYKSSKDFLELDSVKYYIDEVWSEYEWEYSNIFKKIKKYDKSSILIGLKFANCKKCYSKTFDFHEKLSKIKVDNKFCSYRSSGNGLIIIEQQDKFSDTIRIRFNKNEVLYLTPSS